MRGKRISTEFKFFVENENSYFEKTNCFENI